MMQPSTWLLIVLGLQSQYRAPFEISSMNLDFIRFSVVAFFVVFSLQVQHGAMAQEGIPVATSADVENKRIDAPNEKSQRELSEKAPPLSPADSIKTMRVQSGYKVIPVLTEPDIHEPSAIAWDGNGRMYVVEMRTYMQDIDGKNQLAPVSRVSRHEDSNGDGIYDKHTIFADNLSLPRMVLPLIDRVIIRETNTLDLKSYQDTDNDGVADKIEVWHDGGNRGGNLEHQPSGLIWNIDNWIYTTYSPHRYRVSNGKVIRGNLPHGAGQWGLTHDNVGRIFYSNAGGENPATDFQQPIAYGRISLPGEQAEGFRDVFPIDNIPDTQGGRGRLRDDNSLNRFTASCGQSIYRGDKFPDDFDGDLIICEPVGRLVRRAKVSNVDGKIVVSNFYDKSEFIASTDPNFRPVNSATGPDGCLYIVDMYRGIIQEGNWVREGSYLRGVVKEYELQKNIGRGRIFRVEHQSSKKGPTPRMLDETPLQLVKHLNHKNGWWRSQAQKLLVLHNDRSVIPALKELLATSNSPLGRLHALWTLEGLEAIEPATLFLSLKDNDSRVRAAALRISEPFLSSQRIFDTAIQGLTLDPDPTVAIQVVLSAHRGAHPDVDRIEKKILEAHPKNQAINGIVGTIHSNMAAIIAERKKLEEIRRRNRVLAESMVRGKQIYNSICTTCHGADGMGIKSPDNPNLMLAPPLSGSERVTGHKERLTRILISGLIGPVDKKTYAGGLMQPMGSNSDRWIADVATFVRNNWGNRSPLVEAADVQRVRKSTNDRSEPWTLTELGLFDPPELQNRKKWKLSASHNADALRSAIDGNAGSRWDTGTTQKPGMWLEVELPDPTRVMSITLDSSGSGMDYPRGYAVKVSADGKNWTDSIATGRGVQAITEIEFSAFEPIQRIRIEQTGGSPSKYWSIHELKIKGLPGDSDLTVKSLSQQLLAEKISDLATSIESGDAKRGADVFLNPTFSCSKCHYPKTGDRLGPDLSAKRENVTPSYLVNSILRPSKDFHKGFETVMVETIDGITVSGFPLSENDDELVLRDPASGKEITIPQDDIENRKQGKVSLMPAGLANQLADREQFVDLLKFLMEISEGGQERLKELSNH